MNLMKIRNNNCINKFKQKIFFIKNNSKNIKQYNINKKRNQKKLKLL